MQTSHSTNSAPDVVLDLLKGEFKWGEAKITYLGTQTRPILTIVFSTADAPGSRTLDYFTEFQNQPEPHSNDKLSQIRRFTVESEIFRRVIPSHEILVDKQASSLNAILSFTVAVSLTNAGNAIKGREFLLTRQSGEKFYKALISRFEENKLSVPEPLRVQFRAVYP